jgi:hypothetical protein
MGASAFQDQDIVAGFLPAISRTLTLNKSELQCTYWEHAMQWIGTIVFGRACAAFFSPCTGDL